MKTFITFTKTNIFTIAVLVVAFAPLTYAMSQSTQTENTESKFTFSTSTFPMSKEEVTIIPILRVRLGAVQTINDEYTAFVIHIEKKTGDTVLQTETTATTTVYFGDGEKTVLSSIDIGTKIYVFGYMTSDNSRMIVSKIVLAKK